MILRKAGGLALVATLLQLFLPPSGVWCQARCVAPAPAAATAHVGGGCHHGSVSPTESLGRANSCSEGQCCSIRPEVLPALRDSSTSDFNARTDLALALFTEPGTHAPILWTAPAARGRPPREAVADLLCRGLASLRI